MDAAESLFHCLEQAAAPRRARGVRHPFQAILLYPGRVGIPWGEAGVMLGKERVDIAAGEVSREGWRLLTGLSYRRWAPTELLQAVRNHRGTGHSLHHVKDRSWDEAVHTQHRPGLGEVYAS